MFEEVHGCEQAGYVPKPAQAAFEAIFALAGLDPMEGAMFEDDPRNLAVPHLLGMRTVLVGPEAPDSDHIHFHAPDLGDFLSHLT